jgi:predicted nuclease of predicted toxin-antitoxin system
VPAKDAEIWDYAKQHDMLIVTNDEDFFNLVSFRGFPPKVIMLRMGNQSRKYTEQMLLSLKLRIEIFLESTEYGVLEII